MTEDKPENFELSITRSAGRCLARVVSSPAGMAEHAFKPPFSDSQLEKQIANLASMNRSRKLSAVWKAWLNVLGGDLFQAVFQEGVYQAFRASQELAENSKSWQPVLLRLDDPSLHDWPWEYLYDKEYHRFLALSSSTPLVRYLPTPQPVSRPLPVQLPLKLLVMISNPADTPAFDPEEEWQALTSALEPLVRRGLLSLDRLEDATIPTLQRRLRRDQYHAFHYIGHGFYDAGWGGSLLMATDDKGQGAPFSAESFGTLLADHRTLRLVVLTERQQAHASLPDPFARAARGLVQCGIPAVLGTAYALRTATAQLLHNAFYTVLLDGLPVEAALTVARQAMLASGAEAAWGAPVLYSRLSYGNLFGLTQARPAFPTPETAVSKQLEALYSQAMSAYYAEEWARARSYFQQILDLQPDYQDASSRLQEIDRRLTAQQISESVLQANQRIPALISRLAQSKTLDEIGAAQAAFDWLPASLISELEDDTREILPELLRIAKDISSIQAADLYGRRLGLRDALAGLQKLEQRQSLLSPSDAADAQQLPWWKRLLSGPARPSESQAPPEPPLSFARWLPVVQCWQKIILAELKTLEQQTPAGEMQNPYEVGNPLRLNRKALFKGRAALRDQVVIALRERSRPTLVLHGPRRMGKTSFLLQLPALLPGKTIPVFMDLQRPATTSSDGAFFYHLARAIAESARPYLVEIPAPVRERFDERPYEAFDIWLYDIVTPRLQDNNLLLCLDEFEKAGHALDAGKLTSGVLDQLRHLIQHQEKTALLFAGVQALDELGPNWSSYFINVRSLTMSYLQAQEAEELIRNPDPEINFPLKYTDEAVASILGDTLGHPYLIQLVCSSIVEQANLQHTTTADQALVEAGTALALERGEPYFRNVWDEMAGADGQSLLSRLAAGPHPVNLEPLDAPSRQAVERMLRIKVIRKQPDGYSVEIPLVARWVKEYTAQ